MTNEELKQITKQREKRTLEYKEAWSELPSNLFETVCAFLYRDGGVIVLGAHDDGTIIEGVNINAIEQMSKNLANMSNNSEILKPTFLLQPEIVDIDETTVAGKKQVIVVQVPSSSQVHSCKGRVFDRSMDGDFQLRTDAEISAAYLRKSNPHMANFYVQLGRAEHLGTGIRNIYRYAPLYSNATPVINDEDVYKVIIALPMELVSVTQQKSIQKDIQKKLKDKGIKLTEIQLKVVMAMGENPSITRTLLCQKTGLSEATIITCISALKKKKVIIRKGGRRYGEWVLVEW